MQFNPLILLTDIKTFFQMAWAVLRGKYKMPWSTFIWTLVCLIYFLSPIDAVPDIFPLLGSADDGAFFIWVLTLIHKDLAGFRQNQKDKPTIILDAEVVPSQKEEHK